jgi:hypothetical protein
MKNKLLLTMTSLLLASALVACGTKKGDDKPVDPTPVDPDVPPTPPAPTVEDWPADFKPDVEELLTFMGFSDALPGIANGLEYEVSQYSTVDKGQIGVAFATAAEVGQALTAYQQNLLNGNFTEAGVDEFGDMYYTSPNSEYQVNPWDATLYDIGNYIIIDVYPYVEPVTSWPTEEIAEFFEEAEATLYDVPAFVAANATFKTSEYLYMGYFPYGVEVDIIGATEDEIDAYLGTTLPGAGWTVDLEQGTATKTFEELDGVATLAFGSLSSGFGMILPYTLDPIPSEEWPTEKVAALVETASEGSETVVPSFDQGDYYTVYPSSTGGTVYVGGEDTLLEAYVAVLQAANWTAVAGATNTYDSPAGDIRVAVSYSTNYGELVISVQAVPSWKQVAAEAAAIVEALAPGSETVIPGLPGGTRYSIWHDAEYAAKSGEGEIDVYGVGADLLTAYTAILGEAGWTAGLAENQFISPNEDILIELNKYTSFIEICIRAYEKPAPVWPAEDVAEALGDKITDTLPAFEGECEGFNFLSDAYGTAVLVTVGEGNEAAAIESYEATLAAANWTTDEDYWYSPNEEIIVEVYVGTAGSITIAFMANPVSKDFPMEALNDFLTTYDFGFEFTEALPDAAGEGYMFQVNYSSYYDLHYGVLAVSGNQLEAWAAILQPLVEAAGYLYDPDYSTDVKYDFFRESDYGEIILSYNEESNVTSITFWEHE